MLHVATHFAPAPQKLRPESRKHGASLISIGALVGVPALVREIYGEAVLRQANRAAMLDVELIEDRDLFIPHATMTAFVAEVERRAGERRLGLLLAPHLSISSYGTWGEYVLGAGTLGAALGRIVDTMGYHSRGDRAGMVVQGGAARFSYLSAARGRNGYPHIAVGTVGVVLSLFRSYLPGSWRPEWIALDLPRRDVAGVEAVFGCPVRFDAKAIAVGFAAGHLEARAPGRRAARLLTVEELARARMEPATRDDMVGIVAAQVRVQVMGGEVSIDGAARALDTSTRTLQRALGRAGTDFRSLVGAVRLQRAKELLGSEMTITEIALGLGYSAPGHFSRAFRKGAGVAPQDYRTALRAGRVSSSGGGR
jgi:AraC-like DNA-binding protein